MLKKIFWYFLGACFPWIVLLLDDNPGGAIIALIMQATIIGWIPASIWALGVARTKHLKKVESKTTK